MPLPHADVYRHDARGCEWYVKVALNGGRLYVISFHPSEQPMRVARVRVTMPRRESDADD
jgi:hypothetical protein